MKKPQQSQALLTALLGFVVLLSFVSASQKAILKGGSREVISLKDNQFPIDAIEKYERGRGLLGFRSNEVRKVGKINEKPEQKLYQGEDYELRWDDQGDLVNFGFSLCENTPCTGDSIAQWMVPLAGAIVKKIIIYVVNFEGTVDFCLFKSNYKGEASTRECVNVNGWIGLYEDNIWVAGDNECFNDPPLGEKIWPSFDSGCFTVEITIDDTNSFVEVNLESLAYADVGREPFFIVGATTRTAGWGLGARYAITPYHSFKYYYEDGTSGNPGWHIRSYGWELYCVVEYYEDIPPLISDVKFSSRLPESAEICATITDKNPSGGPAGIDEVILFWEANGIPDSMNMVAGEDNEYCATLDRASVCELISWIWIGAVDVMGNWSYSDKVNYWWGDERHSSILILFDGLPSTGFPTRYYFHDAYDWWGEWWNIPCYDIWAYGAATEELLDLYSTIIEITTKGPSEGNALFVKSWLDEGGKNYILAGDDVVGHWFGWPGKPVDIDTVSDEYAVQSISFFQYLGIETYYGDINFAEEDDLQLPWPISAVEGDVISGALYNALETMLLDTAVLLYDPYSEINASNWLDGFEVDETVTIAFTAQPNPNSDYDVDTLAIGFYKEDESLNNKVVFLGFDPLSINSEPYIWWGATPYSPLVQALDWMSVFDLALDDELDQAPNEFELNQNYPNPFNPITTIEFSIPQDGLITLTVYDILGREVDTILNQHMQAGQHKVQWNARNIPSGIYLMRMKTSNFFQVRKVMVVR